MAFFRTVSFNDTMPGISGAGVTLRPPNSSDFAEWAALRRASRDFLVPWEPTWPVDDLTRSAFRRRLRRYAEDQRSDESGRQGARLGEREARILRHSMPASMRSQHGQQPQIAEPGQPRERQCEPMHTPFGVSRVVVHVPQLRRQK